MRMVEVGDGSFSRELCGGTHLRSTAEVGVFRIIGETASAANVRRIEAITGPIAVEHLRAQDRLLEAVADRLNTTPSKVLQKLDEHIKESEQLQAIMKAQKTKDTAKLSEDLVQKAETIGDVTVLVSQVQANSSDELLDILDRLKNKVTVVVLGSVVNSSVNFVASVAADLAQQGLIKADELVRHAAGITGGGGGGRPTLARAGGRDLDKLDEAMRSVHEKIVETLKEG